jgi:hypothetical protein
MKAEIVPFGIITCACGAMPFAVHHLHPDCVPGKDLCEIRMVHLKDGHEREPMPTDTGAGIRTVTVTASTSSSLSLPLFPVIFH